MTPLKLMKRIVLILCLGMMMCYAHAQQYVEVGVFGGLSNYQGDLAPVAFVPKETHAAFGAFYKFNLNYWFAFKGSLYSGLISGNDDNSTEEWKQQRNLSFQTPIQEASLYFELFLKKYNPNYKWNIMSPYIFFGISLYHFNPRANYMGVWYDLQPLGTEGQGNIGILVWKWGIAKPPPTTSMMLVQLILPKSCCWPTMAISHGNCPTGQMK